MKKVLGVSLVISMMICDPLLGLVGRSGNSSIAAIVQAQEYSPEEIFSSEQLDNLLAPIALYPDPLLAQVLLAATFVDEIDEAARWMRAFNNFDAIDDQPWDVSVKAVTHYPSVLYMMSDQIDWTTSVGQAYVYQSTDVMTSIQRLRALARSAGNLVTNDQQQVDIVDDYIQIVPAQPRYLYVPTYDPNIVYLGPASYFGLTPANIIFFGPAFAIGAWLNHDCNWRAHRIYYHGWRGTGWIARSRPIIRITNIYINNNFINVRINRNIVRQQVNYINLNRYNSVHRDVSYNNLSRNKPRDTANANTGNKIIRRNLDVTDPRLDDYRGRPPVQAPVKREDRPSPAAPPQRPALPQREDKPPAQIKPQPAPIPQGVPAPVVRPRPQPSPVEIQRPPNTVFGGNRSTVDPRAASQRGQESRSPVNQPTARPPTVAPNPPVNRTVPGVPGRRP
jgi:hypothetical protein